MIEDIRNPVEEQMQREIKDLKERQRTMEFAFRGLAEKVNEIIEHINLGEENENE